MDDVTPDATGCAEPAQHRGARVVVVGAGLSGLACARTLVARGWAVTLLDKGRRPGGRATSRRDGEGYFDHGAQFFTARGKWLTQQVSTWETNGVVARWDPRVLQTGGARARRLATWWVGTPNMGALAEFMANGLDVRLGAKVTSVARAPDGTWSIEWSCATGAAGDAPLTADELIVTLPAAQCAALLSGVHDAFARVASQAKQTPCWAVMAVLRGGLDLGADVFEDGQGSVAWATREASKPGRQGATVPPGIELNEARWLLHASAAWSEAHSSAPPEAVEQMLMSAFFESHGVRPVPLLRVRAHLWRYAQGHVPEAKGALFDPSARLAVCGDWLNGSRIEGALTSGVAAAEQLLSLATDEPGA